MRKSNVILWCYNKVYNWGVWDEWVGFRLFVFFIEDEEIWFGFEIYKMYIIEGMFGEIFCYVLNSIIFIYESER